MVIEYFEHVMPGSTDRAGLESLIDTVVRPAMEKAGYRIIRWCWADVGDEAQLLVSFGEHESPQSLKQAWQRKEMLEARERFNAQFPGTKVSRRILRVIEG